MNKKSFPALVLLVAMLLPLSLSAQQTTEKIQNFLDMSSSNPMFPIMLLIGALIAGFAFFYPRFGLIVMLFFMLISTDMQLDQSAQGRSASIRLEDIILILVSGGWLLKRAKTRSLTMFRSVPINRPILLMAVIILLASCVGYIQETLPLKRGILFTLKRIEYFWLFFMTLNIMESDKEVKNATNILIYLTIFISLVGAIQFFLYPLSGLTGGGATSTSGFGRANTLADFYLIVGGMFLGLLIYAVDRKKTLVYMGVMVLCTIAIIMTKSRGAYVSIPPLIITILVVTKNKRFLVSLGVVIILLFMYFIGMTILRIGDGQLSQGAEQLTQKHTGDIKNQFESIQNIAKDGPEVDSSFNARYSSWINNIDNIIAYPILGHGVGSVPLSYFDCQHVREMYETGLLGFLIFMYMNFTIFMAVLSLFYMTEDPFTKGITCGFLGGHVGMMIHGWSIANFYTIMNMEVFWFVIAMIMILYHNHLKREEEKSTGENDLITDIHQPELF